MLKINKYLPIKYHLNLHLLSDIPHDESIMFEIIRFLISQINKKDESNYSDVKFTSKTLKYVFGDMMNNEEFKKNIIRILKQNIENGNVETSNNNMYIKDKLLNKFYSNQ